MLRAVRVAFSVVLSVVLAASAGAAETVWVEGEAAASTTFNHHGWFEGTTDIERSLLSPGVPESTDGAWIAHYTSGASTAWADYAVTVTEGGAYRAWIRLAPRKSRYEVAVDGGAALPVQVEAAHETVDLVRPGIDDVHYLGWVDLGSFALAAGPHTIRVTVLQNKVDGRTIGGIDCLYLSNEGVDPAGAMRPGQEPPASPDGWFALRVGTDPLDGRSVFDLSDVVHRATGWWAGQHGPVRRVSDHLELEDRPGVAVKLWGLNSAPPADPSLFDRQARFYVKYGINLVRRHFMLAELGESVPPSALDLYDLWFATLKEHGIYSDWSVFYPDNQAVSASFLPAPSAAFSALLARIGLTTADLWGELPASGDLRKLGGFDSFVEWYADGHWQWLEPLLDHVNPYTGLRYADDPALAFIEAQNEDNLFWHWPLGSSGLTGSSYPKHALLLRRMWFEWLGQRYPDDAALAAAWGAGLRAGDSVETFNPAMKIYAAWEMEADGPFGGGKVTERARMGDFIRFLAETQRAHFARLFGRIRGSGFRGVLITTGWKAGGPAAEAAAQWADDAGDAVDRHLYFGGGAGGYYVAVGAVDNASHLGQPGLGILSGEAYDAGGRTVTLFQVEDKPAVMTEWNQNPPNQWRGEIAPLWAFYGMGLQGWDASLHFSGSYPWLENGWPGAGRGPGSYVTETPLYLGQFPSLARAVHQGHVAQAQAAAARRMSVDDLFRGIDPLSQPLPGGGFADSGDLYAPPEVLAIGRLTSKADEELAPSDSEKVDWSAFSNLTAQVVTSITGELVWEYGDRVVEVRAPRTQGVIGFAGGHSHALPAAAVDVDTPFVSLLLTALDDRPLASSEHILITALAQDTQWGAAYSPSGDELLALGGPPLLLEPVHATLTLAGPPPEKVRVLDPYGAPTGDEVPVQGGSFTIDGRYRTMYYEVLRPLIPRIFADDFEAGGLGRWSGVEGGV